ncbi:MAG TPA: hypothetical protein VFR18_21040 [Terriglobia bacterium]|nr:hypothetical protein [Terriglobia bacterium]
MNILEATVRADGTFEFPKVPLGNYIGRINPIANSTFNSPITSFFVGTDNISGLQIPVEVRTTITGRATVVDSSGKVLPGFPTGVELWFYRGRFGGPYGNTRPDGTFGSSMTTVRPDGTFSPSVTEGEYVIGFNRLPPGYTVKSITSGSLDLLKTHLNVEKNVTPPLIQVQIEAKP